MGIKRIFVITGMREFSRQVSALMRAFDLGVDAVYVPFREQITVTCADNVTNEQLMLQPQAIKRAYESFGFRAITIAEVFPAAPPVERAAPDAERGARWRHYQRKPINKWELRQSRNVAIAAIEERGGLEFYWRVKTSRVEAEGTEKTLYSAMRAARKALR